MRVTYATPRDLEEAGRLLREAIQRRAWIVFFAECLAEYEGRGASRTTPGDKLVVVKPDGSVLVHSPRGFKPQNWQPDTEAVTVSIEDELLVVRAVRRRPREVLILRCPRVHHVVVGEEPVEGDFWMYINEHEIRDLIAEDPGIVEEGLRIVSVEKPVEPGFIDLYGRDREGRLVVIELKRVKAGEDAVHQLLKYVEAFRKRGVDVRPILVAPGFTGSARMLAARSGVELKEIDLRRIYEILKERWGERRPKTLTDYL